jgi:hypothetical protein
MDKEKPNEPSPVDEILRKIEKKADTGEYLYRGEPEHYKEHPYYGKVSSKLYRDFLEREDFDVEAEHFDIEVVQEAMLSAARRFFRKTVRDFEILAEIQHYGGKTNLIDFTMDYLIALFMVCDREESLGKDGRIILQEKERIDPYIAEPYEPINRVIAQKSVFVRHPDGFVLPNEDDVINIPADLKKPMRKHLGRYHGVSAETVYNDLHGFIKNQDVHLETYVDFYIGATEAQKGDSENG